MSSASAASSSRGSTPRDPATPTNSAGTNGAPVRPEKQQQQQQQPSSSNVQMSMTTVKLLTEMEALREEGNRYLSEDPDGALEAICDANGLTREDFILRRKEVQVFELFLLYFPPNVPQIRFFPNITTLRLISIDITDMMHLDALPCLRECWLNENRISKIENLDKCTALRELYLQNNSISKIEGLDKCANLEVLWLCRNKITEVEGLEALKKLRNLHLGANKIQRVGDSLRKNTLLLWLNLAANQIASFRDVPMLDHLVYLQSLYFSDPSFGSNPICTLCNYQIFTLYHLSSVRILDHCIISTDQRSLAETTFIKKNIYYNMRIKTLRRNAGNLIKKAVQFSSSKENEALVALSLLEKRKRQLCAALSHWELYISQAADGGGGGAEQEEEQHGKNKKETAEGAAGGVELKIRHVKNQLAAIDRIISQRRNDIRDIDMRCGVCEAAVTAQTNNHIAKLMIELNTGGNIRLEDGKPKDVWNQSCVELAKTRFFASEFEKFNIKELRVNKVTRIHNRTQRERFDTALESMVDLADATYRRALEYLFLVIPAGKSVAQVFNDAAEHGFRLVDYPNGVALSNSVFLADEARLLRVHENGDLTHFTAQTHDALTSQLLVVKVFLGKCAAERTDLLTAKGIRIPPGGPLAGYPPVEMSDYAPTTASVYRAKPNDAKQRVWFAFNPDLVLPEYIVEFSYGLAETSRIPPPPPIEWNDTRTEEISQVLQKLFPRRTRVDLVDFRQFAANFLAFVSWCNGMSSAASNNRGSSEVLGSTSDVLGRAASEDVLIDGGQLSLDGVLSYLGKIQPVLPSSSSGSATLSPAQGNDKHDAAAAASSLPALAFTKDLLPSLKELYILSAGLKSLTGDLFTHVSFSNLNTLVLSHNELAKCEVDISRNFPALTHLDLSHNRLKKLDGCSCPIDSLRTVLLGQNHLHKGEDLFTLLRFAPKATAVSVGGNPVMHAIKRARGLLIRGLSQLESIDGVEIASEREEHVKRLPRVMSLQLIAFALCGDRERCAMSEGGDECGQCGADSGEARSASAMPTGPKGGGGSSSSSPTRQQQHRLKYKPLWDEHVENALLERPGLHNTQPDYVPSHCFPPELCLMEVEDNDSVHHASSSSSSSSSSLSVAQERALSSAHTLRIGGTFINRICHTDRLHKLRELHLPDNEITKISALETCPLLEVLNLQRNKIRKIEGLAALSRLKILELRMNHVSVIEGIDKCRELTFLSLEDNQLTSMINLAQAPGLTEAYLSNNAIENSKEVNQLKEMPSLIIVDLSGNPCTSDEGYRLYTIFQLKKLKVLDGVSIDQQESQLAKDTFAGRISADLLNERMGLGCDQSAWPQCTELNLASCALKDVTLMDHFASLQHLKLDHNILLDISGLQRCTSLVTLNLAFNKLGVHRDPVAAAAVGNALQTLVNLESLSLESNGIQSLFSLQLRLPRLKFLNLKNNEIQRLDGFEQLPNLREVILTKNRLRSVDRDCFARNANLKDVCMDENSIKTIEGIRGVTNLQRLSCCSNRLSEISDLEKGVEGLTKLSDVQFSANAVSRKPLYRHHLIRLLPACAVIDGKEVSEEERERVEVYFQQDYLPPHVFVDVRTQVMSGPVIVAMPQPPSSGAGAGTIGKMVGGMRVVSMDGTPTMTTGTTTTPANASANSGNNGSSSTGSPVDQYAGGGGGSGPPSHAWPNTRSAPAGGHQASKGTYGGGGGGNRTGSADASQLQMTGGVSSGVLKPKGKMSTYRKPPGGK